METPACGSLVGAKAPLSYDLMPSLSRSRMRSLCQIRRRNEIATVGCAHHFSGLENSAALIMLYRINSIQSHGEPRHDFRSEQVAAAR